MSYFSISPSCHSEEASASVLSGCGNGWKRHRLSAGVLLAAALMFFRVLLPDSAEAGGGTSRLLRVSIKPHSQYTRVSFYLDHAPEYSLEKLPGGSIAVTFKRTGGPLFKKLRFYSDGFIGGVTLRPRGENLRVTVPVKGKQPGMRILWLAEASMLALDVGPRFSEDGFRIAPDRERILTGAGKLVHEFDPPFKSIFPFLPTDRRELLKYLRENDTKLFMLAEAFLYKGKAAQAEQLFDSISRDEKSPVRALATFRLGEALYILQKYDSALKAYRLGQQLWPEYFNINPAAAFYYADSIVRSGDFTGGRKLVTRLIAGLADKKYAPLLLVRLADTLARQRHEMEAVAIYRSVTANFPADRAASHAVLKLADRRIFSVNCDSYIPLRKEYQGIADGGGDPALREEALFKATLLESLYGPAQTALKAVMQYEKKYPRGLFISIARGMREELLPIVCRELYEAGDLTALVNLVQESQDCLSRCFIDPQFVKQIDEAFVAEGILKKENAFFSNLLGREWVTGSVPFMLIRIIDNALALGDFTLAENTARSFLLKFPRDPAVGVIHEKLGNLFFLKNDFEMVTTELSWLLNGSRPATFAESYYYLGKALASRQNHKGAERALSQFIAAVKSRSVQSPLLADAYYACAASRIAGGDRNGAMTLYGAGLEIAGKECRDQFLYKMGELHLQEGRNDEARNLWGRIVKEGSDPLWQKMASQSLAELEWREQAQNMSK